MGLSLLRRCCGCTVPHGLPWPQRCRVPGGQRHRPPLREYIETLRDAIDPALPLGLGKIPYGPQQVMFLQADITQLAADTGFAPRTAFADGIRATIAWAKTQKQTN